MARYLHSTVKQWTVFLKNVLEAFGLQKGKFTNGKATFLRPESLHFFGKTVPKLTVDYKYLEIAKTRTENLKN